MTVTARPYEYTFEPATTALVVIDMQRDFVDPGGFGESLGNDVSQLRSTIEPLKAVLAGTDPKAKAVLLLGHLDVVEARREDWTRDPFKLIEESGYFYGRGVSDMKSLAADWIDTMMRLKQEGFKPPRTLKMALTCGEETASAFNGANWLATHERTLIDAEFALNEGGGGRLDNDGKPLIMTVQAAEKFPQDYTLEVTNPGGHSARPVPKNAINQLAAGLLKIAAYQFPIQATDITRGYFAKMAPKAGGFLTFRSAHRASNASRMRRTSSSSVTIGISTRTGCSCASLKIAPIWVRASWA